MVTRDEMRRMARMYDTQVSRAFRRALGMGDPGGRGSKRRRRRRAEAHPERFRGIGECFRNERSPMDGPRVTRPRG